jgi:hypothetical protein
VGWLTCAGVLTVMVASGVDCVVCSMINLQKRCGRFVRELKTWRDATKERVTVL